MEASDERGHALAAEPAKRTSGYLTEHGVEHELIEHAETMTALSEAKAAGVPPQDEAKALLLAESDDYLLAVIPASDRLDLGKVRALTGRQEIRLASEAELGVFAPNLELGALPAIGPDLPSTELVDRKLLDHERIVCSAGDHRHAVRFPPGALLELADPVIADICED